MSVSSRKSELCQFHVLFSPFDFFFLNYSKYLQSLIHIFSKDQLIPRVDMSDFDTFGVIWGHHHFAAGSFTGSTGSHNSDRQFYIYGFGQHLKCKTHNVIT